MPDIFNEIWARYGNVTGEAAVIELFDLCGVGAVNAEAGSVHRWPQPSRD